ELCYIRSKVPDKAALQALIDKARETLDRRLFSSIQQGMIERRQTIIIIISQTKIPLDFSLVVDVAADDTGRPIAPSTVVMDGDKKDAPGGVAVYTRRLTMLDPDKTSNSIDVTGEANGYDAKTESFTIESLANRFDADKAEVRVRVSLRPTKTASGTSEDVAIDVTVTDKKTGDKLSGTQTTF